MHRMVMNIYHDFDIDVTKFKGTSISKKVCLFVCVLRPFNSEVI